MASDCNWDVLIIGSGVAGLSLALRLAPQYRILLLSKTVLASGSTYHAQGGIAAALDAGDSAELHSQDTITVGAGLCNRDAVQLATSAATQNINWLQKQGVQFTKCATSTALHLNHEGGHSRRRIVHTNDSTGKALSQTLIDNAKKRANITIAEHQHAVDLIVGGKGTPRVQGAYLLDSNNCEVAAVTAKIVVLATGGASKVYLYSTNPDISTGDGIALAWRAGCRVANMEFMQFHPTCLYHPTDSSFLISEVIRGEGAKLILPNGARFMHNYHPQKELAPRDIVARAIDNEIKKHGLDCVFLDLSHRPAAFIRQHFPSTYQRCLALGIDITSQPIPVVPAAHYTCGGVVSDLDAKTDLDGLYAVGEVANTGMHGANRMASNSLLECLTFAEIAAANINAELATTQTPPQPPAWDNSLVQKSDEDIILAHNWDELRQFMWDYVGIVRTNKRLAQAMHRLQILKQEVGEYYSKFHINRDLLELRNLVLVAELIILSAQSRTESRGLHYTRDHPNLDTSKPPQNTILSPKTTHL